MIDDHQLLTTLLAGALRKYQMTKEVVLSQPRMAVLKAQEHLQATETRLERGLSRSENQGSAMKAADNPKSERTSKHDEKRGQAIKCFNCNKRGHISRDCAEERKDVGRRSNGGSRKVSSGSHSDDGDGDNAADLAMMAVEVTFGDVNVPENATLAAGKASMTGEWVLDSGASHHMTGSPAGLIRVKSCIPVAIMMADGRVKVADRSGTATLAVRGKSGPTRLTIKNVLLVPGLSAPLFSIRQATGHGYKVEFANYGVAFKDKKGKIKVRWVMAGKLYMLPTVSTTGVAYAGISTPSATATVWHRRFGHLGTTSVDHTSKVVDVMRL